MGRIRSMEKWTVDALSSRLEMTYLATVYPTKQEVISKHSVAKPFILNLQPCFKLL